MSIISAGTTTTTALSSTGNTDGTLQFQVNGTTPSVTLNTLGAIGVGSTPNYGTSGQALVSSGSTAAPTWASVTTSPAGSTGQIQINNAGAFGAVSSGTSGQVLTSAGAGAAPTWATPSSGSLVYLSSSAAYAASYVDFTGFVTSAYSGYLIVVSAMNISSGFGYVQFYIGGTLSTTGYSFCGYYTDSGGSGIVSRTGSNGSNIQITNAANQAQFGTIYFTSNYDNALSGTATPVIQSNLGGSAGATETQFNIVGSKNTTSAITGIRLASNGGTIDGYFYLYGIKKS